jgi:hypothetical protein
MQYPAHSQWCAWYSKCMSDTPTLPPIRRCCHSYHGATHHPDCTASRRGGRPPNPDGPNPTPIRTAGRHGQIWVDCEAQAEADGQTMTAFVAAALARELDHRRAVLRHTPGRSYPGGT